MLSGLVVMLMLSAGCQASCGSRPRRLEFGDLASAHRIEVTFNGIDRVTTVTDKPRIHDAAMFLDRYHEGWIDIWSGPAAPSLILEFYQDGRHLGGFGIGRTYVTVGSLSREVPAGDIAALAKQLRLQWPPER